MKKYITMFILGCLIGLFSVGEVIAQAEFETGKIGINLNNFGRIRILSPGLDGMRQIDRASIVVAVSETEVFTYNNDADTETTPSNISPPSIGDFELYGAFNNEYSGEPPDVIVEASIYGWQDEGYALIKFVVNNHENNAINAAIGIEILPQVDGAYGNELVDFIADEEIVHIHKTSHLGFKILSDNIHTLKVIEWFGGYDADKPAMYGYFTDGTISESYEATGDGSVIFVAQDIVTIESGASAEVYFGFAYSDDESALLAAISQVQDEYDLITSIVEEPSDIPTAYFLEQNYPNPFNPATIINFNIPTANYVTLTIHNIVGQLVATLVDDSLPAGGYSVTFDASHLPSGVYLYTMRTSEFLSTKRMILVK